MAFDPMNIWNYLRQTLNETKWIFDIYPPSHLYSLVFCHWRGQCRWDSRRSVIKISQNYKISTEYLKSQSIFVDLKKNRFSQQAKMLQSQGFKYCPPAPCLAPPVSHEGQQGLLLLLHLHLLDLVLGSLSSPRCSQPPYPCLKIHFSKQHDRLTTELGESKIDT